MSNFDEDSIIASVVMSFDQEVSRGLLLEVKTSLTVDHFTDANSREIYQKMLIHLERGYGLDFATVYESLGDTAKVKLNELATHSTTNNVKRQIDALKHSYTIAKMKSGANKILSVLGDKATKNDVNTARGIFSESVVVDCSEMKEEGFLADYLGEFFDQTQKLMTADEMLGIPFGLKSLDEITQGTIGGDLITVAGRPGMGKSSFASGMMVSDIISGYKPVLFSLELGRKEIVDKMFSMFSKITDGRVVPFSQINKPNGSFGGAGLLSDDLIRMQQIANDHFVDSSFYLRGASRITIDEVIARIRSLHSDGKCDRVYIDHIGLLVQDKNNATAEITNITNSLKLIASELKISVVIVVQLNRGADDAKGEPKLSHLKNSGSIEEDSSIVIFPWRPNAIDVNIDPSMSKIIVAKSRNSGTGSFPTYFCTATTLFTEELITSTDSDSMF